jgi:uncharacterized protein
VLDATYGRPVDRARVVRLAERLGARLVVLLCHADDATLRDRLTRRASDTGTASDARLSIWPELRAAYSQPTEVRQVARVDATGSPDQMLAQALAIVRERLTRSSPRR